MASINLITNIATMAYTYSNGSATITSPAQQAICEIPYAPTSLTLQVVIQCHMPCFENWYCSTLSPKLMDYHLLSLSTGKQLRLGIGFTHLSYCCQHTDTTWWYVTHEVDLAAMLPTGDDYILQGEPSLTLLNVDYCCGYATLNVDLAFSKIA